MADISVVGLGKLGQTLAACLASRGFSTLGVDIDTCVVQSINAGRASFVESQLQDLITQNRARLRATSNCEDAIRTTDVTCILVPTPSEYDGNFSNQFVEAVLASLASALRKSNKPYHLFVINSTVMPGSTESRFLPLITGVSGRRLGKISASATVRRQWRWAAWCAISCGRTSWSSGRVTSALVTRLRPFITGYAKTIHHWCACHLSMPR